MPFTKRDLKRWARKPLQAAVNRIDFVKIFRDLAELEPGRTQTEKKGPPKPAFADQEDIILHTVELTKSEMAAKGQRVSEQEIEEYARSISCKYDLDLHTAGRAGAYNGLLHLFDHQDPDRIFLSKDRRELKHFDTLRKAREDGVGVIYLVNHSTHFDEFIADVVLDQLDIELPLFAAGSNMMVTPSVESVLMIGSYLIIRRGATKTYLATLWNYCRSLSDLGKQQGIFLEAWSGGARTRDGSLRYPRRLVTLQGALAGEKDVLVQPVVISYAAVPEDQGLSERAGGLSWLNGNKIGRNLLKSPHHPIRATVRGLEGVFGRSFITFCQPKMRSELEDMQIQDKSDLALDEYIALYSMREIAKDKKIMASQITARGLIRARQEDGADLVASTEAELDDVVEYHRRTFGQDPDLEDYIRDNSLDAVVEDGLKTLHRRKVIGKASRRGILPTVKAENALQYYATHGDRRLYSPSARENIVVMGAGTWGYGLACLIGDRILGDKAYNNSSLTLYDPREDLITEVVEQRTHPVHFPKIRLPKNVFPASDSVAAYRKATEVVISVPVDHFETDFRRLLAEAHQPLRVIIASRGFDTSSHQLPIQMARNVLRQSPREDVDLLALSGPVTPNKLAEGRGGSLVLAGPMKSARTLSDLLRHHDFTVFVCDDPVGVQVASIMAEVYTLLGTYLLRTKAMKGRGQVASFFVESSREVIDLAVALGGKRETFQPDNPAWTAEYVAAGMGGPGASFGRQAGRSLNWAKGFRQEPAKESREDSPQKLAYYGIRSAYLTAKNLGLHVPRLRQAYRIFWKD
jgi:glycerol-3-phosphate dehydrogenase